MAYKRFRKFLVLAASATALSVLTLSWSHASIDPAANVRAKAPSSDRFTGSFEDLAKKMREATVFVGICDLVQGKPTPQGIPCSKVEGGGSGFFINPNGLMITARHVIPLPLAENKAVLIVQKSDDSSTGWWAISRAIARDLPDSDVVTVQFELPNKRSPWLSLSQSPALQGEEIAIFGYPDAAIELLPNGQINGQRMTSRIAKTIASSVERRSMLFKPNVMFSDKTMIEAQFVFARGNSGGPIVSTRNGRVVGIVTGAMNVPQDVLNIKTAENMQIAAVPFATFSYGISIDEFKKVVGESLFSMK